MFVYVSMCNWLAVCPVHFFKQYYDSSFDGNNINNGSTILAPITTLCVSSAGLNTDYFIWFSIFFFLSKELLSEFL